MYENMYTKALLCLALKIDTESIEYIASDELSCAQCLASNCQPWSVAHAMLAQLNDNCQHAFPAWSLENLSTLSTCNCWSFFALASHTCVNSPARVNGSHSLAIEPVNMCNRLGLYTFLLDQLVPSTLSEGPSHATQHVSYCKLLLLLFTAAMQCIGTADAKSSGLLLLLGQDRNVLSHIFRNGASE